MWFHTKDIPGSHTVLLLNGAEASEDDLFEAAAIAAFHSKGSDSENVPVDYTRIKYVDVYKRQAAFTSSVASTFPATTAPILPPWIYETTVSPVTFSNLLMLMFSPIVAILLVRTSLTVPSSP